MAGRTGLSVRTLHYYEEIGLLSPSRRTDGGHRIYIADDVVRLQHPAQAPLDVTAADVVFAHATPGVRGRRLAALVVAPSNQENS